MVSRDSLVQLGALALGFALIGLWLAVTGGFGRGEGRLDILAGGVVLAW